MKLPWGVAKFRLVEVILGPNAFSETDFEIGRAPLKLRSRQGEVVHRLRRDLPVDRHLV